MNRNIQLGFVKVVLLNGMTQQVAYIGEYDPQTLQTRCMVNGQFIQVKWNGFQWVQVQG